VEAETVVAEFRQGALTGDELEDAIAVAVEQLADDDAAIADLGVDADEVRAVGFVVSESAGMDPASIILMIAIGAASSLTADAVKAVLGKVLRRVRDEHGEDAVGAEEGNARPGG
jgi:hypothetical protein